ncbi:MAG: hypothetical protein WC599_11385 [Bacteroidales bacterium]
MRRNSITIFLGVTIFAIAMGYLESTVVIYLREIYYPEGFAFPLRIMNLHIALTEIFREFATLVMLGSVGFIAGRTRLEKFGFFIFAFGIWDIFFYIFLKLLLGWPESLFTWDILFLLPTTWVGPVLAPVINAITMIIFGVLIWYFQSKDKLWPVKMREWIMLAAGSLIVFWSYIEDYVSFLHPSFSVSEIFFPKDTGRLIEFATHYVPQEFNWVVFGIGQLIILAGIGLWYFRERNISGHP